MMTGYRQWSQFPYAGEKDPPTNPVRPDAGSWPMYYFDLVDQQFYDKDGTLISFDLKDPNQINWEEELEIVQKTLEEIEKKQIRIAKFWGTGVPTKSWTPIIDRLIDTYGIKPPEAGRILSAVHTGINDVFVITWHYKFLWNTARPNQYDTRMETTICTPRFPSYPSGHSVLSGCTEKILGYFFPAEAKKLKTFAEEASISRLYGGIHFPADLEEGLKLGRQIGEIIVKKLKEARNGRQEPVDLPPTKNLDAKLAPPPYKQALPFEFKDKCTSKVRGKSKRDRD